jgi:tetratricopeptide (TPR) repeat protein
VNASRALDPAAAERQLLASAIEHHNAGRWRPADELYERVVRINRRNHEALHRWALLKQAQQQHHDALRLLDKAIHIKPNVAFAHCHRGYVLQDLGRRKEAVASLERAVRLQPDLVDAHIGLGTIHAELGDLASASASFDKAAALDPRAVEAMLNKGIMLEKHDRLDAAIEAFDRALRIAPGEPNILHRKAACLRRKGDIAQALAICDAVLAVHRDFAPVIFEKGVILAESGEPADAIAAFERAFAMRHLADACHYNIGNCLKAMGDLPGALAAYQRAVALRADHPEACNSLGDVLRQLHRPAEALLAFERSILIKSSYIDALINRAETLLELDRAADAFAEYDRLRAAYPDSADLFNSLGNTAHALGRYDEALAWYAKALSIDPKHRHAMSNAGTTLQTTGRFDAALERFAQAVAIKPDFAEAHLNAGRCRLEAGDYAGGWPLYEWRWKTVQGVPGRRSFPQPLWLGDGDVAGKTVLVWAEQGFGDMLQSVRYAPLVAARGARVVLLVPPQLRPLFARIGGVSDVVAYGADLPAFDLHCPMMSLPLACGTTLETVPANMPYLHADSARVAAWRERLSVLPGLKVGLVWAGSHRYLLDRRRSMTLAQMAPFATVRDVTFVSLQKDEPALQAREPPAGLTLRDWTGELDDFDDTAALITALDLVISVDTAVVHLTAGLGKPVWVLNRYDTDWRWLQGRDDSPWYPSVRLFRQVQPGDWGCVVERVRAELEHARDDRTRAAGRVQPAGTP